MAAERVIKHTAVFSDGTTPASGAQLKPTALPLVIPQGVTVRLSLACKGQDGAAKNITGLTFQATVRLSDADVPYAGPYAGVITDGPNGLVDIVFPKAATLGKEAIAGLLWDVIAYDGGGAGDQVVPVSAFAVGIAISDFPP